MYGEQSRRIWLDRKNDVGLSQEQKAQYLTLKQRAYALNRTEVDADDVYRMSVEKILFGLMTAHLRQLQVVPGLTLP